MRIAFNRSVSAIAALAVLATISGCATTRKKGDTAYIARDGLSNPGQRSVRPHGFSTVIVVSFVAVITA